MAHPGLNDLLGCLLALGFCAGCEPGGSNGNEQLPPRTYAESVPAPPESAMSDADHLATPTPFDTGPETIDNPDSFASRPYATRLQRAGSKLDSHLAKFQEHFDAERYDEAVSTLRDALRERPDDPELLYLLATTYRADGNSARAEASLVRTLEFDPRHIKACKLLCVIMAEDGRFTDAAQQIDALAEQGLADADAFLLRASARLQGRDYRAAEQDAAEALRLDPSMVPALLIRSAARLQQGQVESAQTDLDAARQAGVPDGHWQRLAGDLASALRPSP